MLHGFAASPPRRPRKRARTSSRPKNTATDPSSTARSVTNRERRAATCTHDRTLLTRYGKHVLSLDAGLLDETPSSRPAPA